MTQGKVKFVYSSKSFCKETRATWKGEHFQTGDSWPVGPVWGEGGRWFNPATKQMPSG